MGLSIVIPVYNGLDYTRHCVESIAKGTRTPYELIIIDNGSTDGTQAYVSSLKCVSVCNKTNLGCAAAWNQGIRSAKYDWVCILNNDTVVPARWNEHLVNAAEAHSLTAVMPAYREGDLDYPLEKASMLHAQVFRNGVIPGAWHGISMMIRRDVFESVGYFDEGYRYGKYEDADFIRRLQVAGHRVGLACGVLIHHYGSKTVDSVKKELGWDFEEGNHRYFLKTFRWGRPQRMLMKFSQWGISRRRNSFDRQSMNLIDMSKSPLHTDQK